MSVFEWLGTLCAFKYFSHVFQSVNFELAKEWKRSITSGAGEISRHLHVIVFMLLQAMRCAVSLVAHINTLGTLCPEI